MKKITKVFMKLKEISTYNKLETKLKVFNLPKKVFTLLNHLA